MAESKKVWTAGGNKLRLGYPEVEIDKLENIIYSVGVDDYGFFLYKANDSFEFTYKVYGLETKLINRVVKTYESSENGNLGILLNGVKGTGKTMTAKLIANSLKQPVILVGAAYPNIHMFLNSIPQNITIFIDEYEKVFEQSTVMLTIMDGMMNSDFRRLFILTTNNLYIDKNLIERPGRIRYLKTFDGLEPKVIEEIVDDILEYPEFKQELISFVSNLQTITVDIVKSIINEVNIHNEGPSAFESVFNVSKLTGRYDVSFKGPDGDLYSLAESVKVYPKPMFDDSRVGYGFEIDNKTIGRISKIINYTTIEVALYDGNGEDSDEIVQINIEHANIVNYAYAYDGYGSSMVNVPKKKYSELGNKILNGNKTTKKNDLPFDEGVGEITQQITFRSISGESNG